MPIASQFFQVSEWQELVEMVPVREHRQCLLRLFLALPEGVADVLKYKKITIEW